MVTPCILSTVMLLWAHTSVHSCGIQIASEIGPYKMGNRFEYEAGLEKSGKDHKGSFQKLLSGFFPFPP